MKRSRTLPGIAALCVAGLLLGACGDDSTANDQPSVPDDTLPTVTSDPASDGYTHPTGADEIVFEYAERGGFVPREWAFKDLPVVLISGDGRVITVGPTTLEYPGKMLPNLQEQSITEEGMQALLAAAEDAGLFADLDYGMNNQVADVSTATVTFHVNGETYSHAVYALAADFDDPSMTAEQQANREALRNFLTSLNDLGAVVGEENLGASQPYTSDEFRVLATPVEDPSALAVDGIEPTIVEWPADASVRLADASECALVPTDEVADVLADATELTLFTDAGVTYQLAAVPLLPGASC